MSQETPRPQRLELLRARLAAWAGQGAYREAARHAAPRSREDVPVVDLVHEPPELGVATLLGLLEQDRFEAPILLIERGLDRRRTPFVHHENATAALGALCVAVPAPTEPERREAQRELLNELLGVWLIAAVADFPEAHEAYLRDLARGMGLWMVPRGWSGTLLHASPSGTDSLDGLLLGLVHEAVVERAPGIKLRTVGAALGALETAGEAERPGYWRHALAFVVGSELFRDPQGRLRAEYQAHRSSPASRHRRAVDFIRYEAIPAYHSVRD